MIRPSDDQPLTAKAQAAFVEAARDVIARARANNTQVVLWRDGQVVRLSPEQAEQELAIHEAEDVN